ncbi:MAG: hypothetical protein JWR10_1743 [Rubritepida sp.]|nr:hypothetical protein [Rubritepida sp.]
MTRGLDLIEQRHLTVPSEQLVRQAVASLGGHLFQAVRAASEWIQLGSDAKLLVEVAEDYAIMVRDALDMTQTKQEFSASVTLRSDGVRKSLAGLVAFQESNPTLKVSLAYLTTAEPGREAKSALPEAATGIGYWRDVARGADIAPLRQLLLETQRDEQVLKHVREANDEMLRTLVQRVTWLTGSAALPEATAALEARLRSLGLERTGYADDGERVLPFLIHRILQTSVAEHRVLTRDDFEQEWRRSTTVNISVSLMRQMAALGSAGERIPITSEPPLPALSVRTAPRRPLVDDLRRELQGADVVWLHGSSGIGKSLLIRLMAARCDGRWEFISLKGCKVQEQEARVRAAVGRICREDFAGLIFDDLPVPAGEGLRSWIAAASIEIAANPNARIIVSSEREPLPQVRKAFDPLRIVVRKAPYLDTCRCGAHGRRRWR